MFAPDELLVLPLSADSASKVRSFYDELGLTALGIFTSTTGGAITKLGLPGIPGTLLIDADGNEIGRKLGPLVWDSEGTIDTLREHFRLPALSNAT